MKTGAAAARRRGLLAIVIVLNLLVLPFAVEGLHFDDTDAFYHLAGGRWMAEHHRVLDQETFSFTAAGRPWVDYYWLAQRLFFAAHQAAGLPGVIMLRALLVLATCNLMLFVVWQRTRAPGLALGLALLGSVLYLSRALNVRPYLFSYLLLLVVLALLERFRRTDDLLDWRLPLAFVAWANLHGVEYPVGLAALGAYALGDLAADRGREVWRRRALRWPLLLACCTAALLVNPFGPRLLATVRIAQSPEVMSQIDEMRPLDPLSLGYLTPDFEVTSQAPFNAALLAALLLVPRWLRRRDVTSLALVALGAALALSRLRFRVEFAMLVVPVVAAEVARAVAAGGAAARAWRRAAIVLAVYLGAACVVTSVAHARRGFFGTLDASRYPVGATRFLQERGLAGNVLCAPGVAGYVTWALPGSRILMDMRTPEPFGPAEYWLARSVGSQVPLERIDARWPLDVVLVRHDSGVARRLLASPEPAWLPVWTDDVFVAFAARRLLTAGNAGLALRFPDGYDGRALSAEDAEALRAESARLLAAWDGDTLAHESLLRLALAEGRPADAHAQAVMLRRRFPRHAGFAYLDGIALLQAGDRAGAEGALAAAIDAAPDDLRAYPARASLLAEHDVRAARALMEDYARRRSYALEGPELELLASLRERDGDVTGAADARARAGWLRP